jgi:hypothetical protein
MLQLATASTQHSVKHHLTTKHPNKHPKLALQGCDAACLSDHLHDAAQRMGGVLEPAGPAPSLILQNNEVLPLDGRAAWLFASELGALHGAARARLSARWAAAGGSGSSEGDGDDDVSVFHATLVGLQALSQHAARSGAPAAEAEARMAAANEALVGVIKEVAAEMERAFAGDVVYQITLLGDAGSSEAEGAGSSEEGEEAEGRLEAWREVTRRSLLQGESWSRRTETCAPCFSPRSATHALLPAATHPHTAPAFPLPNHTTIPPNPAPVFAANSSDADAKAFSVKATGYGIALLLVYVTAAVLYAMVNMPFKQVGRAAGGR